MTTRSVSRALALVFLLLPAAPVAPRAAEGAPEEPYKVRVNLAFFTGPQRYSMDDINKGIAEINSDFSEVPELEAAGLQLEDLTSGFAYGAGIRVWPVRRVLIGFDYQKLTGSTSISVPVQDVPSAESFNTEVRTPTQSFGLNVGYLFDWPSRKFRLGAAAGASYYKCDGAVAISIPGYEETIELRGGSPSMREPGRSLSATEIDVIRSPARILARGSVRVRIEAGRRDCQARLIRRGRVLAQVVQGSINPACSERPDRTDSILKPFSCNKARRRSPGKFPSGDQTARPGCLGKIDEQGSEHRWFPSAIV